MHTIQIRQRVRGAAHYGVWRDTGLSYGSEALAINYAERMAALSHSLDIRVTSPGGPALIVRDEGDLS